MIRFIRKDNFRTEVSGVWLHDDATIIAFEGPNAGISCTDPDAPLEPTGKTLVVGDDAFEVLTLKPDWFLWTGNYL